MTTHEVKVKLFNIAKPTLYVNSLEPRPKSFAMEPASYLVYRFDPLIPQYAYINLIRIVSKSCDASTCVDTSRLSNEAKDLQGNLLFIIATDYFCGR